MKTYDILKAHRYTVLGVAPAMAKLVVEYSSAGDVITAAQILKATGHPKLAAEMVGNACPDGQENTLAGCKGRAPG